METSTPSGCKGTVARICSSSRIYILFLHAVVLLLMAVLLKDSRAISSTKTGQGATWCTFSWPENDCTYTLLAPAQDVISYDTRGRYSTKDQQSIYAGLPRPDYESAWAELITRKSHNHTFMSCIFAQEWWLNLLLAIYIRISRDELLKAEEPLGENTTMLKDGGYPAILGAYHELHCVVINNLHAIKWRLNCLQRQLRFFLYQEHYYPNLTMPERALLVHHLGEKLLYSFLITS